MKSSPAPDFEKLQRSFDQIYVLTLDRATERHEHIKTMLQGIDYRFFKGIDKLTLDYDELVAQGIYDDAAPGLPAASPSWTI